MATHVTTHPVALERIAIILLGGGDAGVIWIDGKGHIHIDPGNNPDAREAVSAIQAAVSLSKVKAEGAAELTQKLALAGMQKLSQATRAAGV